MSDDESLPPAKNDQWRKYHPEMRSRMALEQLKDAVRQRNKGVIEQVMTKCKEVGVKETEPDMKHAAHLVDILDAKQRLKEAEETNDYEQIFQEVDRIRDEQKNVVAALQQDLLDAESKAIRIKRQQNKAEPDILVMDRKTMSELRRYFKPPKPIKKVMQAAFLLLGEDEQTTEDWANCQRMLNPQGPEGLNRRVMEFDANKVHPEIAARSKVLLDPYTVDQIRANSAGAATFYIWAMGAIEEIESSDRDEEEGVRKVQYDDNGDVKPAESYRQLELLNRKPKKPVPMASPRRLRRHDQKYRPAYRTYDSKQNSVSGRDPAFSPVSTDTDK